MRIPEDLNRRIARWNSLSRWERSEVGRGLRRLGLSYGEIREVIDVKKSTLATWCRDINLSEGQKRAILARTGSRKGIPVDTNWRRRREVEGIRKDAGAEATLLRWDPLWVAGVVLYWAEGAKTRNHLSMANSDPAALRLFIRWLKTYISKDLAFVLQLHLHEGNDEIAARAYWQQATGLLNVQFHKTFIKPPGTGHRKNNLVHGVCTVKVRAASDHWQRVMAWIDELRDAMAA